MPPIRRSIARALAAPLTCTLCAASLAGGRTLQDLALATQQLLSPHPAIEQAGMAELESHRAAYRTAILDGLAQPGSRAQAANAMTLWLSPWARGVQAGRIHRGQLQLFQVRRPVPRAVDHPDAPLYRKALLDSLDSVLQESVRAPDDLRNQGGTRALALALTEVADGTTRSRMAALLSRIDDPWIGEALLSALALLHGEPPPFQLGGICGNSSPEEIETFARAQRASYLQARDAMIRQVASTRDWTATRLMQAALDRLATRLEHEAFAINHYNYHTWSSLAHEPLVRIGEPLLPLLEPRREQEPTLIRKAHYAIIAATISGRVDSKLMNALLEESDATRVLACQLVAAAGSRNWNNQIAALQHRPGFNHHLPSHTLASVLREEALPFLRAAAERDPDNYTAHCAIKEIEAWSE